MGKVWETAHGYKTPMHYAAEASAVVAVLSIAFGSLPVLLYKLASEDPNPFTAYGSYWGGLISLWALVTTTAFIVANNRTGQEINAFQRRYYALMEIHRSLNGIQRPTTTHKPEVRNRAMKKISLLMKAIRKIPSLRPQLRGAMFESYKAVDNLTPSLITAIYQKEEWTVEKAPAMDEHIRASWSLIYDELRAEIRYAERALEALNSPIHRDSET